MTDNKSTFNRFEFQPVCRIAWSDWDLGHIQTGLNQALYTQTFKRIEGLTQTACYFNVL